MSRLALMLLPVAAPAFAAGVLPEQGMPQLAFGNPLTISQVVWMLVIFGGLYLVLSHWALPMVSEVLDERAKRISADLSAAQHAKATADAAVAEMTTAARTARAEAQAAIAKAAAEAQANVTAHSEAVSARLNEHLAAAEVRIGEARRAAMGALRQVAAETTGALVARLTGASPDPQTVDRAVGGALSARGGT